MPTRRLSHACAALVLLLCVLAGLCDLFVQSTRLRSVQRSRGARALRMDADHEIDLTRAWLQGEPSRFAQETAELPAASAVAAPLAFLEFLPADPAAPPGEAPLISVPARGPPSFS